MIHRISSCLPRRLCIKAPSCQAASCQRASGRVLHPYTACTFRRSLLSQPHCSHAGHQPSHRFKNQTKQHQQCFSCAPIAAGASSSLSHPTTSGPVLPLSERPVQSRVSKDDLLAWHAAAVAQAEAVGSAFEDADGGPSAEDLKLPVHGSALQIELNWLLDDAVDAAQASADSEWKPCTWRQLQSAAHIHHGSETSSNSGKVALRADIARLAQLWKQRTQDRVPLQYLNNCCHWRDFILAVGPGTLIPRPETEILIDLAQQAVQERPQLKHGAWLDLGTGSGAIAIGLAAFLPQTTQVYAVDKSDAAAAWANLNAQRLGLTDRIQIKTGSWYEPVQDMRGQFAGIVSNPPYIPQSQVEHLQAEVRQYEPWLALDGGQGPGLESLTVICCGASHMLQPGGFLAVETTDSGCVSHNLNFRLGNIWDEPSCIGTLESVAAPDMALHCRRCAGSPGSQHYTADVSIFQSDPNPNRAGSCWRTSFCDSLEGAAYTHVIVRARPSEAR